MTFRKFYLFLIVALTAVTVPAGTWTPVTRSAPTVINLMLLLSDGTVMAAQGSGNAWYRLTPDVHGSYVNGTWSTLASMHDYRFYYSSTVLTNGTVLVAGGEFGTGASTSELYDPVANIWSPVPVPTNLLTTNGFQDAISKILPDGNVLLAPVYPATNGDTALYLVASNSWTVGPKLFRGTDQSECSWVKLPDDSILTVDNIGLTNSERYIPSQKKWVNDGNLPAQIYSPIDGEFGGALLLPDGRALFLGGNGNNALYTPSGTAAPGTWAAAAVTPGGYGIQDGPAAMMANGKILCQVGSATAFVGPSYFYEYDPVQNSFTATGAPNGASDAVATYESVMLDLPDGSVLYSHYARDLYVYRPDGSQLASGKPTISNIVANADGSFTLAGTQLNGISEGATYGDDEQMNSNFPLVRLTDAAGNISYERTYNWSSTGVMTGNKIVTTRFTNSAALPSGIYSLNVVANGISSDPWSFILPPRITPLLSGNSLIVTWPTNVPGFLLESATNLNSPTAWSTNPILPSVLNGQNVVTNPLTAPQMFFRLIQ